MRVFRRRGASAGVLAGEFGRCLVARREAGRDAWQLAAETAALRWSGRLALGFCCFSLPGAFFPGTLTTKLHE